MKVVLQRVKSASVKVDNSLISEISSGYLLLWCIEKGDIPEDIETLTNKIINLRIFPDEQGKMNKSIIDANGEILLVSQFTLSGNIQKGNRPSFINSQDPEIAKKMIDDVENNNLDKEIFLEMENKINNNILNLKIISSLNKDDKFLNIISRDFNLYFVFLINTFNQ